MSSVEADWQQLDRRTVAVTAVLVLGVLIGVAVPVTLGIASDHGFGTALAWVVPIAALVTALSALADFLRWRATRYRVTEERVELRFEFVFRSSKTLARERVRTVDVTANPLLRLFGLAELTAGTGQGASAQERVKLSPLPRAVADRLRQDLLQRDDSGVVVHARGTLATLDPRWIRYAPVSVLAPTLGAAAFGAVMQVSDWFGFQNQLIDYFVRLFSEIPLVATILLLIVVGLIVGVIASLGLFIELWWNYHLEREPGGTLRVRRGLLTTRSVSIEEARLRGIDLVEPLGNRALGAARLDAVATGMRKPEENNKTDYKTLLPAAPRPVADRVAADVLRETVPPTSAVRLVGHPIAARNRRIRGSLITVAVFCGILALLGWLLTAVLLWLALVAVVILVPISIALALDAYRNLGHGITGSYLVTRSGAVRRSTVALLRAGVIGWTFKQSFFQRRLGLITVTAVTAAGTGGYDVLDAAEGDGVVFAETAVPGLLEQFTERA